MKYVLSSLLAAVLVVAIGDGVPGGQIYNGVNPPGNERRSMGNLRPATPPATAASPAPKSTLHRPWTYGNPPYYKRPPAVPYYVPYYPRYGRRGYYVLPYRYGIGPYYPYHYRCMPRYWGF